MIRNAGRLLLAIAFGCGTTLSAAAVPVDRLLDELQDVQQRHKVPFMTVVVLQRDAPPVVYAGHADGSRASPETPFRWGSITKTVTALALIEAARQQDIALATPVPALLPALPYVNPWAPARPLRLHHLLELSAGMPDLRGVEFADNRPLPLATALARGAERRRLLWPPGLQHSYSNVPPGISAAVIEQLTDDDFEHAVRTLVLEPLGMADASFGPMPGLPGGFRADGRREIPYWHMTFRAFGALNASPAAMTRLMTALLGNGRIADRQALPAATIARAYRVESTLAARAGLELGYGAGLYGWVRHGHVFHGHGGDADGYRSRMGLLRDAGRGYLVGINVDDPAVLGKLVERIEAALIADLPTPEPAPAVDVSAAELDALTGTYYPSATRFAIERWLSGQARPARVERGQKTLIFLRGERRELLIPLDGGGFRRPGDPQASVVFAVDDGVRYLLGALGNYVAVDGPCPDFLRTCAEDWPTADGFGKVQPR